MLLSLSCDAIYPDAGRQSDMVHACTTHCMTGWHGCGLAVVAAGWHMIYDRQHGLVPSYYIATATTKMIAMYTCLL